MGDQEAEHTVPQTEIQVIASKISDLNKWRNVFSFHSLEISNSTYQQDDGNTGNGVPGAREPLGLQLPVPLPRSAIPEPLLTSPDAGGQPISLEMAMELRKLLFGNVLQLFSCEWAKACFRFREPYSDLAYALETEKGGARAILMAVQAYIIKYLLFIRTTEYTHLERLCRVSRQEQGEALAAALADTLWAAGGGGRAVICLVTAAIHVVPSSDYKADNFTERIHLFEFSEKAAAQEFILGHINCFKDEQSHGVILFLYSLLFSRTLERVREDLDGTATPLLKCSFGNITCTQVRLASFLHFFFLFFNFIIPTFDLGKNSHLLIQGGIKASAVLSLLLTGRANPHELDGSQELGPRGEGIEAWQQRGPVGYLHWSRAQAERQVCPRLRTPRLPIWLCSITGRHSILFGTDSQILSDWKREKVFHLYFYNGQLEQTKTAHLTIAFKILIRITGKRTKVKTQAAQGRAVCPWRWQSGPSGQTQLCDICKQSLSCFSDSSSMVPGQAGSRSYPASRTPTRKHSSYMGTQAKEPYECKAKFKLLISFNEN
ncbi:inactive ubiquitin carboxyl-terminal hydrolase MINDY-4B [Pezoporus flaviventris]|uniref:inactive ubiquitin carboxyl-terminal hydrolase MINDY-4B n=1 Tax=Pezoporus flaviventris TaxID=889875 RepID=UPI002AB302B2|nr:inactive ubiquitin carboxyl-terminal hydrolase MINDY-4B [Pezoporus flaviventris]